MFGKPGHSLRANQGFKYRKKTGSPVRVAPRTGRRHPEPEYPDFSPKNRRRQLSISKPRAAAGRIAAVFVVAQVNAVLEIGLDLYFFLDQLFGAVGRKAPTLILCGFSVFVESRIQAKADVVALALVLQVPLDLPENEIRAQVLSGVKVVIVALLVIDGRIPGIRFIAGPAHPVRRKIQKTHGLLQAQRIGIQVAVFLRKLEVIHLNIETEALAGVGGEGNTADEDRKSVV